MMESFRIERDVADALKALGDARKLKSHRITTLLANGQYHLAQFETPAVPVEERAEALRWKFKDTVDFPVDTASIGVLDVPMESGGTRQPMVYAVAAGLSAISPLMKTFDASKVPLDAIDIPELAQRNVAALFEEENRGLAFLALDDTGGLLTITYRGELYAVRRIEVSATQLAEADADRRSTLLERVMLELQRTLDNFDRQYSFISVAGLMTATCPAVPDLQSYLAQNLYVQVREMNLANVFDLTAVPELTGNQELQAQYLLAIGAALRTGVPT
jgi:MSHA biogenesis protein MshI